MVIKKLFFFAAAGLSIAGMQAGEAEKKHESDEEVLSAIHKINSDSLVSKVELVQNGDVRWEFGPPIVFLHEGPHAHYKTYRMGMASCSKIRYYQGSGYSGIEKRCSHDISSRGWAVMHKLWKQQEKS